MYIIVRRLVRQEKLDLFALLVWVCCTPHLDVATAFQKNPIGVYLKEENNGYYIYDIYQCILYRLQKDSSLTK